MISLLVAVFVGLVAVNGYSKGPVEPESFVPWCSADVIPPFLCGNYCQKGRYCAPGYTCCRSGCYVGCYPDPNPEKPGSCPDRKFDIGACYVDCDTDADCPGSEKCCGSCPRVCEKPCGHD